jgi:hypothetical protein
MFVFNHKEHKVFSQRITKHLVKLCVVFSWCALWLLKMSREVAQSAGNEMHSFQCLVTCRTTEQFFLWKFFLLLLR